MNDTCQIRVPARRKLTAETTELERWLARAGAELERAREALSRARDAVAAAEGVVLARKCEREAAAIRVADLVDLVESLQAERALYAAVPAGDAETVPVVGLPRARVG